ncbi:NAD(P)/FAD-dependent oxidoreductase [uncultured Pseudokineococcus sp.]|uniref:NAD(P)/FAD-dependent oxidoreductase n=1 Tax=uncultured Pseudokineococcus sp. TaxID=1642928 RepID=UPI00262FA17C|nr:FAD/NAD(P)-binding oxidoreductase [uncultured Pseudokineococcus sp.]
MPLSPQDVLTDHAEVLVIGGGNAGISLAARLIRDGARDVALVEPSPVHRYRPLMNYVGGGEATMRELERPMRRVIPEGCRWVQDAVEAVDPVASTVTTRRGRRFSYGTLVVCPGMHEDWDATPGLQDAYTAGWASSTYVPSAAPLVWQALSGVREGTVLFTVPPEPAPCAATALKPLLMACDSWRRSGVLDDLDVVLAIPGEHVLGVPKADARLERVIASYGVRVLREARVARVDPVLRAVDLTTPAGTVRLDDLAHAHVVPHYRAPEWVTASGLGTGERGGQVDIDPETLRSRRHDDVWSIGDVAALQTSSSGGGLRKQVDVLARNIIAARKGRKLRRYDGFTVMPVTTSHRRLVLVEADRSGPRPRHLPLVSRFKPRRTTWLLDRYVLPVVYYRLLLRGKV